MGVGVYRMGRREAHTGTYSPPPGPKEGTPLRHTLAHVPGRVEGKGSGSRRACPRPGGAGSPLETVGDGKQQLALLEGLHLLEGLVVQGQEAAA